MEPSLKEKNNQYIDYLIKQINTEKFDVLNNFECCYHLFFGEHHIEQSKTSEEIFKLRDEKYSYLSTYVVIVKRNVENKKLKKIDIEIIPPF